MINNKVPKRRFKGFTDDWEQRKLGEITNIKTGSSDLQDAVDNGEYPFFVRSENVERSNRYIFDGEAILIPGEGRLGDIYHYINGKFDYHQRVYKISDFADSNTDGKFVLYYLQQNFKRHALKFTVKATVDSLRLPMLVDFEIKLPNIDEQHEVGVFFSNLDNLITLHQRKLKKLVDLKSSYLEKMFPEGNKNIPKLRFKKFENKAKWVKSSMSEFYQFSKGKNLLLSSFNELGGNYGIAYGHLYTEYNEVIKNVKYKTTDEGVISKKGDILFPGSSTVPNGTAQANALMLDNIHLGGDVIIARDVSSKNYPPFVSYLINAQHRKMFEITTGTTITHMYGKDIAKLEYHFPEYEEQKEIGYFFSKLENIIELQNEKLVKLKNLKQAYLNELFVN